MAGDYKYFAFISYSHADERWSRWLHRALETYRIPKRLIGRTTDHGPVPSRLTPVFRDRDELRGEADLSSTVTAALEASRHLIVICSSSAARSRWVDEEVRVFKRMGRQMRNFDRPDAAEAQGQPFPGGVEVPRNDDGIRQTAARPDRIIRFQIVGIGARYRLPVAWRIAI